MKNALSSVGGQSAQPGIVLPPPPDSLRGDEDLFVDAAVDKTKVYVGQQVTASWHLYTQSEILKYRPLAEPKYEDFWSEDLFVPTSHLAWDRAIIKGQEYEVALLLKKALFPLKAGKLAITRARGRGDDDADRVHGGRLRHAPVEGAHRRGHAASRRGAAGGVRVGQRRALRAVLVGRSLRGQGG